MTDAHVHLEKGDYTIEWIEQFIDYAIKRNIDEIFFLEHTHIFKECQKLYDEMSVYNTYQKHWYQKKRKLARPLKDYTDFIEKLKQRPVFRLGTPTAIAMFWGISAKKLQPDLFTACTGT